MVFSFCYPIFIIASTLPIMQATTLPPLVIFHHKQTFRRCIFCSFRPCSSCVSLPLQIPQNILLLRKMLPQCFHSIVFRKNIQWKVLSPCFLESSQPTLSKVNVRILTPAKYSPQFILFLYRTSSVCFFILRIEFIHHIAFKYMLPRFSVLKPEFIKSNM